MNTITKAAEYELSTPTPQKKLIPSGWQSEKPTACIVFADGTIIFGKGLGAPGAKNGELCFNTAMTGYQEILTDPSYHEQIVTFTFPHIGNVGVNSHDFEDLNPERRFGAVGAVFKEDITSPANYRAAGHLNKWLKERNIIAICNVDTRAITHYLRKNGAQNVVISYSPSGEFDYEKLKQQAKDWSGINGLDLAIAATATEETSWEEGEWCWQNHIYKTLPCEENKETQERASPFHIVAIDYGIKRNILRILCSLGGKVTIVPAKTSAKDILALKPDGIFLSNGPGDPAATASYAVPILKELFDTDIPIFGICLGHQLICLAVDGKTEKMQQGHHGANHPVKNLETGKVEIVAMNHGFTVSVPSLPDYVKETHISLFDGTNCGLAFVNKDIFSVQHHPEGSAGPQDSYYLFKKFKAAILKHKFKNKNA